MYISESFLDKMEKENWKGEKKLHKNSIKDEQKKRSGCGSDEACKERYTDKVDRAKEEMKQDKKLNKTTFDELE